MSSIPILGREPHDQSTESGGPIGWRSVPWRTIVATVAVVVAAVFVIKVLLLVEEILVLIIIAGFFAASLNPLVVRVERRVHSRRALATAVVMFLATAVTLGTLTAVLWPVRQQAVNSLSDLHETVDSAARGEGQIGRVVERLHLRGYVVDHKTEIDQWVDDVSDSSVSIARQVLNAIVATVTVLVLTFLFLTNAGTIGEAVLRFIPEPRRPAAIQAAADAGRAISGFMAGNLFISVVAGVATFACLVALGVPNALVLSLVVAIADLVPLVGATIGTSVAAFAAFVQSSTAGFVVIVFLIIYQQLESHVLSPLVMSRAVRVNPLVVILSVLVGAKLFGVAGSLLAIPLAGATQVGTKAARHEYLQGRLRIEGAVGAPSLASTTNARIKSP